MYLYAMLNIEQMENSYVNNSKTIVSCIQKLLILDYTVNNQGKLMDRMLK
jgi:hypothetical protein